MVSSNNDMWYIRVCRGFCFFCNCLGSIPFFDNWKQKWRKHIDWYLKQSNSKMLAAIIDSVWLLEYFFFFFKKDTKRYRSQYWMTQISRLNIWSKKMNRLHLRGLASLIWYRQTIMLRTLKNKWQICHEWQLRNNNKCTAIQSQIPLQSSNNLRVLKLF